MGSPEDQPESPSHAAAEEDRRRPVSSGQVPFEASRDRRRAERRAELEEVFADPALEAALDVLALMDLAWHDCYGESCPPASVIDDVITLAAGDVVMLARAALLAVTDARDTRVAADERREQP